MSQNIFTVKLHMYQTKQKLWHSHRKGEFFISQNAIVYLFEWLFLEWLFYFFLLIIAPLLS